MDLQHLLDDNTQFQYREYISSLTQADYEHHQSNVQTTTVISSSATTIQDYSSEIFYTESVNKPQSSFDWSRLQFIRTLNNGSFGSVSLFRDSLTDEIIAVKVMAKAHIIKKHQTVHVVNERLILSQIDHPFIIKLFATNQDEHHIYMAMRYESGGDLFTYMRRYVLFPNDVAKFYAAELVLVLEYLHANHIVHRDLKLENVLLDADGHVKLADFGFAKRLDSTTGYRTYTFCGTPDYLSPEMIMMRGHSTAVDWWALGILIFEMLTGCTPFPNLEGVGNFLQQYERIRSGVFFFPPHEICHEARLLIRDLLQVDPTKRLGNLRGGAKDVKNHPWFNGVDFDALARKMHPGGVPIIVDPNRNNFGAAKPIVMQYRELTNEEQLLFADF